MIAPFMAGKDAAKVNLRSQLDQLIHKDNLVKILERERELTVGTDQPSERARQRLSELIKIVCEAPINPQLQHWVGILTKDNKARRNKYQCATDNDKTKLGRHTAATRQVLGQYRSNVHARTT